MARLSHTHRLILGALLQGSAIAASAQTAIDGFHTLADNSVEAITVQSDGKILLGGAFAHINYGGHASVARLTVDGSIDAGFSASADSDVLAIAEQANGQIVIGGGFAHVDNTARNYLARVAANGSLDAGYDPNANGYIACLALQGDGKLLVGGNFTHIAGQSRNRIVRLNTDGSLDATFSATANGLVAAIVLQPDGKIVIGGDFSNVDGQGRVGMARLYPDGHLDAPFAAHPNSNVFALALQADGKIVAGGQFTQMNTQTRHYLARVNANGTLDASFRDLNANGIVDTLVRQGDGQLIIGGDFTNIDGGTRYHVARITRSIFVDPTFDPDATLTGFAAGVAALALQSDGKLLVGGEFDHIGGQARGNVARFYPGGSLDDDLSYGVTNLPAGGASVQALARRLDDKIAVGGYFNQLGPNIRHDLGQLNADGTVDMNFGDPGYGNDLQEGFVLALGLRPSSNLQPDNLLLAGGNYVQQPGSIPNYLGQFTYLGALSAFDGVATHNYGIYDIVVQADDKVLLGGDFYQVAGQSRFAVARIGTDGMLDGTFGNALVQFGTSNSDVEAGIVHTLLEQPDGKIVIGGVFDHVGSLARLNLARLNADGSPDATFSASLPGTSEVEALALQPDGRILVASDTIYNGGNSVGYVTRLNTDGGTDANFQQPNTDSWIRALSLQADGKILVGGAFTQVNGYVLQEIRHGLVRLNADGTIDAPYADINADSNVLATLLQPDGKLVIGGLFTQPGYGIARLTTKEAALQSLQIAPDGSVIAWQRSGNAPELQFPPTLSWSDGVTEYPIGTMSRFFGAWVYSDWSPPLATLVHVHARSYAADGSGRNAGTQIESWSEFYAGDVIFANSFE